VNKKFWDRLPADVRGQLEVAMKESTEYANRIAREENDAARQQIRSNGMTQIHVPTPEERLAFKKALVPAHRRMETRIGAQIIGDIYRQTAFDPSRL
ncbi:MAG TPA: C4-dicarboxylate ABC transporter, partial [Methyloversatilis sp.]